MSESLWAMIKRHYYNLMAWFSQDGRRSRRYRDAAIATLVRLGYTWNGGKSWKPPLGKAPNFDLIDALKDRVAAALHEADEWEDVALWLAAELAQCSGTYRGYYCPNNRCGECQGLNRDGGECEGVGSVRAECWIKLARKKLLGGAQTGKAGGSNAVDAAQAVAGSTPAPPANVTEDFWCGT